MIREAISKLMDGEDLTREVTEQVMDEIMQGEATSAQIASFLTAMRLKGESIDEITACVLSMRKHGIKLEHEGDVLEIVGTGGDESYTFNISTVSSFVISAAGIQVAKHGNRSVSSKCGAADVLEALGVKIDIPVEKSKQILKEINLCFMFATMYHSSMKYAAPVRKELGVRTIFNILGPLSNPAEANLQLLGVYDKKLVKPLAEVLVNLGVKRAIVVHGHDGIDEVSLCADSTICEVRDGNIIPYDLNPEDYGFKKCKSEELVGGDPLENARIARRILNGEEKGPKRDVIILNAAVCIYLGKDNTSLKESIKIATDMIESGKAMKQLEEFIRLSNEI